MNHRAAPPEISRTDLAEDRTILANERTFAGWMRTSLACIAIGIGFHALFQKVQPSWVPRSIATAFLLLSVIVIVAAERRATAVTQRLSPHVIEQAKPIKMRLFAATISFASATLAAAIWMLEFRPS